jgi:hypothetical protein
MRMTESEKIILHNFIRKLEEEPLLLRKDHTEAAEFDLSKNQF